MPANVSQQARPRQFARAIIANKVGKNRFSKTEKQIARELNYSPSSVENTATIKNTQAFQETYKQEEKSYLQRIEAERLRVIEAMSRRNLSPTKYHQLAEVTKTLTHDIQLLSGGLTEKNGTGAGETLAALIADIRAIQGNNERKQVEHTNTSETLPPR